MIGTLLLAGLALAARPATDQHRDLEARFDRGLGVPPATWPGPFDRAPVAHWAVPLPGDSPVASARTERTRPVVVGGDLYVGSAAGEALYRLSRRDGSVLQSYPASASVQAEPLIADDRVYFTDTGGSTWCYATDGTLVWEHQGGAPILVRPTLDGGRLYVTNVDGLAVALDAATGALVWRYQRPPDLTREAELTLYAAPPAVVADGTAYLGFSDGYVVAADAARGDILWEKSVGEGTYPDLVAAPVVLDGVLFASGYFAPFAAVDTGTQNEQWKLPYGAAHAPLLAWRGEEAVLYHPGTDGVLHAVVARTGEVLWEWDSGTHGALTTPVLTDAGLFLGSSAGQVYLVDPSTGVRTWEYHERVRLQGVSSPPTVDGRQVLFVTSAGQLHSLIVPAPTRLGGGKPYPAEHRRP